MQKLVFRNANGIELDLTTDPFGITEWEGFSADELNIQSQQVPFQDGGVFLDALLNERTLSVTVAMNDGNDLEKRYRLRREMISKLNPKLGEGVLIYTNDYLSKQIHCIPQMPVFQNKNSNDSGTPKVSCSFTACNPYWEDLEDTVVVIQSGDIETIQNNGDVPAQVKIEMDGIVNKPKISNLTTGKSITYNAESDGYVEIETYQGEKSVISKNLVFKLQNFSGNIRAVIYVNDYEKYFAVGDSGVLLTSNDGINWQFGNTGVTETMHSIAYSETLRMFVAVGGNGTLITSSDGINWNSITTGLTQSLEGVVYSEEKQLFLVAGYTGKVLTSPDGVTWTLHDIGSTMNIWGVTYSTLTHKFYCVGTSGTGLRYGIASEDGTSWESISLPSISGSTNGYTRITYAEDMGLFVVTNTKGQIYTSTDGTTWTLRYSASTPHSLEGNGYCKYIGLLVVLGSLGDIITSSDGINWEVQTSGTSKYLWAVGVSDFLNQMIICGQGVFISSKDGENFDIIEDISIGNRGSVFAEDKDLVVACGDYGRIITSSDGINWQNQDSGVNVYLFSSIAYSKDLGMFCVVGENGQIYTSLDGVSWTSQTSGTSNALNCIFYNKETEQFIIAGNSIILTSFNGTDWETQTITSTYLRGITYAYNKQLYVAVGNNGIVLTSPDGTTWTSQTSGTSSDLYGIAYSEELGIFVIVGNNIILSSKDGINWVKRDTVSLNKVYFENNEFLAVGNSGKIYISYDGKTWEQVFVPVTTYNFNSACWYKNRYLVFSFSVIMTSDYEYSNSIQNLSQDSDIGFNLVVGENQLRTMKYAGDFVCKITYRQKYIGV